MKIALPMAESLNILFLFLAPFFAGFVGVASASEVKAVIQLKNGLEQFYDRQASIFFRPAPFLFIWDEKAPYFTITEGLVAEPANVGGCLDFANGCFLDYVPGDMHPNMVFDFEHKGQRYRRTLAEFAGLLVFDRYSTDGSQDDSELQGLLRGSETIVVKLGNLPEDGVWALLQRKGSRPVLGRPENGIEVIALPEVFMYSDWVYTSGGFRTDYVEAFYRGAPRALAFDIEGAQEIADLLCGWERYWTAAKSDGFTEANEISWDDGGCRHPLESYMREFDHYMQYVDSSD